MRRNRVALSGGGDARNLAGGCTGVPGDDEDNDDIMDTEAFSITALSEIEVVRQRA